VPCVFILLSEDAPAPNALHPFKAYVANGKIHVTANPAHTLKDNKARPPKLLRSGSDAIGKDLVIIGGGSGAFNAVESLREVGFSVITNSNSTESSFP
jgi:apoptosis-inducing factor 3